MRKFLAATALCALTLGQGAMADLSQRPEARPQGAVAATMAPALRPVARPARTEPVPAATTPALAPLRVPVPRARPAGLGAQATPAAQPAQVARAGLAQILGLGRPSARGSVCGDRAIRGEAIAPIEGRLPGCGVAEPVRVTALEGVTLSQPSIMDCPTALALKDWIAEGARPAVGTRGGGLAGLKVAAHYVCRTRNHKPGAKLSEHAKGRAVDISALILADGAQITVAQGWDRPARGRILRAAHGAACGPFGTVLGPEADRYHRDHFHFDTARYRAGSYCR